MTQGVGSKTILITGATDGLGKKAALDLACQKARVILHGRSREKGKTVVEEIRDTSGNPEISYYTADFSSLDEVRTLAGQIRADQKRLDVLINNAGIGPGEAKSRRQESRDGHELRFAVNYLATFLLTHRLLPLLRESVPSRIVNVASAGQQAIDFDDVMLENGYDGLRAYRQSKLAMILFTFDLAEQLKDSAISVNCLHPATLMPTNMVLETDYFSGSMDAVDQGAEAVQYLAASPELEGVTGAYFNGKMRAEPMAQAYDTQARQKLRELSRELTRPDDAA
ncbi:NAD(P)-dependent dehydrogenase (short-subunit alcohol dehydrogenase family) [Desulfosalsimonas propionicica]|uniref:NAD(P)-dependent dehydrogenase (Short-subunit alcohol dehydrogenase family) n=1 Tax=Desulfosalsimonas propionicica TaxID=332175 RepID=A0A7W0CCB8_9BACT|nr:SDR family NAD(P)-dependent oxidoreductase [Desulfosalsimonas propionicica]MBA2883121.1 NAD(P)-dependent dehydrogenase (short-subunit alcohol dehydrogenase family) [Desulfosalsimonas propionicica]